MISLSRKAGVAGNLESSEINSIHALTLFSEKSGFADSVLYEKVHDETSVRVGSLLPTRRSRKAPHIMSENWKVKTASVLSELKCCF